MEKLRVAGKKKPKIVKPYPAAAKNTPAKIKVLEGDSKPGHGEVTVDYEQ
jgi:hypothetical protein